MNYGAKKFKLDAMVWYREVKSFRVKFNGRISNLWLLPLSVSHWNGNSSMLLRFTKKIPLIFYIDCNWKKRESETPISDFNEACCQPDIYRSQGEVIYGVQQQQHRSDKASSCLVQIHINYPISIKIIQTELIFIAPLCKRFRKQKAITL